jgi:hypothetical protein
MRVAVGCREPIAPNRPYQRANANRRSMPLQIPLAEPPTLVDDIASVRERVREIIVRSVSVR